MKKRIPCGRQVRRGGPVLLGILAACVLLFPRGTGVAHAAGPMIAHTGTAWAVSVAYPGDKVALPDGEHVRNRVETWKVDSTDPRIAGRRTLVIDSLKKADGTTGLRGTWIGEPGVWAGGVFTGSGGFWEGSWSGVRQADGSAVLKLTARGKGGPLDGVEFKETATRAAGAEPDPALAIALSGRVAPPNGWYEVLFEDDFEDGILDPSWKLMMGKPGSAPQHATLRVEERNGRLTLHLDPTDEASVLYMYGSLSVDRNVRLEEGQTLEGRLDLAGFGAGSSQLIGTVLDFTSSDSTETDQRRYAMLAVNNASSWISKAYGDDPTGEFGYELISSYTSFMAYRAGFSLVLSVTRSGPEEALVGMRVLQRDQGDAVRLSRTWTDTTAADPATIYGAPDVERPPYLSFGSAGFTYIIAADTPFAPVRNLSLTVESFSLRLFEAPPYAFEIERAVLLTPPPSAQPFTVEAADGVNGPWTILSTPAVEVHGRTHLVVPAAEAPAARLYRIR